MTLSASIYATAVTFCVHSGDESIIFKTSISILEAAERERRQPDVAFGCGMRQGLAPADRAEVWLWYGSAVQTGWLLTKNKMSPQEIGTTPMKHSPSSLYCPGIKGLEMLFLVLRVTSMSSYPHNLFEMWQELDPSLDKNLTPAHASAEISARLKHLAAPGQNNV